jgi:hypothetical protein
MDTEGRQQRDARTTDAHINARGYAETARKAERPSRFDYHVRYRIRVMDLGLGPAFVVSDDQTENWFEMNVTGRLNVKTDSTAKKAIASLFGKRHVVSGWLTSRHETCVEKFNVDADRLCHEDAAAGCPSPTHATRSRHIRLMCFVRHPTLPGRYESD